MSKNPHCLSFTGKICRRYLVIFLIGAIVVSLAIGGISVYEGGLFWRAAKVASEGSGLSRMRSPCSTITGAVDFVFHHLPI